MKKMMLSIGALALLSLVACNKSEEKTDTSGSVPAKVVSTDVENTEIIISEDSLTNAVAQEENQAQEDLKDMVTDSKASVEEAGDVLENTAKEAKEKGKKELAKGAKKTADTSEKVADKLSE